ncbi:hypothetical protein Tdes44962_MAKER02776, partial [Teratosphaeria destructans]
LGLRRGVDWTAADGKALGWRRRFGDGLTGGLDPRRRAGQVARLQGALLEDLGELETADQHDEFFSAFPEAVEMVFSTAHLVDALLGRGLVRGILPADRRRGFERVEQAGESIHHRLALIDLAGSPPAGPRLERRDSLVELGQ